MPNALNQGGVIRNYYAGQDDAAQVQQANRLNQMQQTQYGQQQDDRRKQQLREDGRAFAAGIAKTPKEQRAQVYSQWAPQFASMYPEIAQHLPQQYDDVAFGQLVGRAKLFSDAEQSAVLSEFAPQGGQDYTLTPGSARFGADGKQIASVPASPPAPKQPRLAVTADPQSPTGFVYTDATDAAGKPAPAPRAQTSGKYSPKEMENARNKLRTIQAAKQQLQAIKSAREKLRGAWSMGGPGGLLPTEAGSNFDGAVDTFRSTVEGLTRTPGIGAQSDFEARLNQAKLPSRNEYESTADNKIRALENLVLGLESGYGDLLSEGQQPAQQGVSEQDILDAADAILNGE